MEEKLSKQGEQLKRIADALETIIKMVKQDQDALAAYRKKQDE